MTKLSDMTYNQLRARAKALGITLRNPTRDVLVSEIRKAEGPCPKVLERIKRTEERKAFQRSMALVRYNGGTDPAPLTANPFAKLFR